MDEVFEERRTEGLNIGLGKLTVPVTLDVPVGVFVLGMVGLDTGSLDLLETPLRQVDIASPEVATQHSVSQTESACQSTELAELSAGSFINDFHGPMILRVANGKVSVRRDFVISFCNGRSDGVRVKVATGLGVNEANHVLVLDKSEVGGGLVVVRLVASGVEEPVVVRILVVVASNLLLAGSFGVGLDVRVKQSTTVAHVLESGARSNGNFEGTVSEVVSSEIGLEERAHLGITGTRVLEDDEVRFEASHVDNERDNNQTTNAGDPVSSIGFLRQQR